MSIEQHPNYTAEQALARRKEGNERFVNGQARFPTVQKEVLADLAKGQQPYATIPEAQAQLGSSHLPDRLPYIRRVSSGALSGRSWALSMKFRGALASSSRSMSSTVGTCNA